MICIGGVRVPELIIDRGPTRSYLVQEPAKSLGVWIGQYRLDPTWSYWADYGGKVAIELHLDKAATYDEYGVLSDGGPVYAKLSINTHHDLLPGEFVLNHDMRGDERALRALLDPEGDLPKLVGMFEDTGKMVSYGFVSNQPVWRLTYFAASWSVWRKELEP